MKMFKIAEGVDLTDAASSTAVQPDVTPFLPGSEAVLAIDTNGMTGGTSPSFKVESSDDGTTYSSVKAITAAGPLLLVNVIIANYYRVTVTSASSAGTANVYLLAGT